ncbi:MAG: UDP-N-acetylmuramoyl-L-alanyl-D-glutamate--2,6-diaminopimelate ligase [Steroidobacteraceae bacterium]
MTSTHETQAGAPCAASSRVANLRQLLAGLAGVAVPDIGITDLCMDSRDATPGCLFLAVAGTQQHGLMYLDKVTAAGARVVLWEPAEGIAAPAARDGLLAIAVPGLKACIGRIADRYFDQPSARVQVAGITGTNGKTTTAHLIAAAMGATGQPTTYAGTLGYGRIGALNPSAHTTPDCITVHRRLAERCEAGDRHVSMEVSSHALDQGRVDAVRFHTAVFTNLTRDHLDYHKTLSAYAAAKARLFQTVGLDHAVINVGDEFGNELVRRLAGRMAVTAYHATPPGTNVPAGHQLFARSLERGSGGLSIAFDGSWGPGILRSRLLGDFNAENLLAALAVLLGWEVPLDRAVKGLETSSPPPGRMEVLPSSGPLVVIDYAHTPDALAKVIKATRQHTAGRVICVFGCGGNRDAGKRPLMGAIAEELADVVVLTDDNPRREDPAQIIASIQSGMQRADQVRVERQRAEAIAAALDLAGPDDAVLIAGKGHETGQVIGDETLPFNDREVALHAMRLKGLCP